MSLLRLLNRALFKLSFAVAMTIVAIMVMALSLSAITRFISGTGYDWLIELPPVLVCWLVFPLLGPYSSRAVIFRLIFYPRFCLENNCIFSRYSSTASLCSRLLYFSKPV